MNKACQWYAEFEGVCCNGDNYEYRADICPHSENQKECPFYADETEKETPRPLTVGELIDKLSKYSKELLVMYPSNDKKIGYTPVFNVSKGVNELDGCVFLDDYIEEE